MQCIHPDLLATAGINVVHKADVVEVQVPWRVSENESETERNDRYQNQEAVIQDLLSKETPEMVAYRQEQMRDLPGRARRKKNETEEQRRERLERSKNLARKRRAKETPEEKLIRLEKQRARTQRNRESRNQLKGKQLPIETIYILEEEGRTEDPAKSKEMKATS